MSAPPPNYSEPPPAYPGAYPPPTGAWYPPQTSQPQPQGYYQPAAGFPAGNAYGQQQYGGYPQQYPAGGYPPQHYPAGAAYPQQSGPYTQQPYGQGYGVPPGQTVVVMKEQPRQTGGAGTSAADCCLIALCAMCCACCLADALD